MNILKNFGIKTDEWSQADKCMQCGRELYTHLEGTTKFCSPNCERVYKKSKQYEQELKDLLPGQ